MVFVRASFVRCAACGRLNIRDSLNPVARCTTDCHLDELARHAAEHGLYEATAEPPPQVLAGVRVDQKLMDLLAAGHDCPSTRTGNPDDCAFGNVGCVNAPRKDS